MILCPTLLFSEGRGQWKPSHRRGRGAGARAPTASGCQGNAVPLLYRRVSHGLGTAEPGALVASLCSGARPGPALSISPHPSVSPAFPSSSRGPQGKAQNCAVCAKFLPQEGSWQPAGPGRWPSCSLSWKRIRRPGLSLCVPWAGGLRKPVAGGGQCLCPAGRPEGVAPELQSRD